MIQKLISDYFKADEVDNLIVTRQIALSSGVDILISLMKKIEEDIGLLDKKEYDALINKIKQIRAEREPVIARIRSEFKELKAMDSYEEEGYALKIKNEEHEILQKILSEILGMMFKKGWIT
jgi:uncharacterized coiled-coil DUF342 family protein